ncbi:MAG TPA: serine/threonine-protein kinase [Gemmatimonadaceae bacterium]|nr:serine/threonine-protein kinase [Gemmatimonadaceae bacterium]
MTEHVRSLALPAALRDVLDAQFDLERPLGAGAMGSVFLARDRTLDRPVAIKVISPELSFNQSFRQRFLQEARTVARLRHHNLVTVHAAGEAGGVLYYVMEHVPGESLRQRLEREGRLAPLEAARILHELTVALAYAHAHGVVHRDVKPENVLLDEETGRALLADFGVAHAFAVGGDERVTESGFVVGSPRYMSPEQAAGESQLDGRSDIYALGLVGYEMLAGAPPFTGPGARAVLAQQITAPAPPLAARAPDAPPELVAIIERALQKEPAMRWPDARAMERALATLLGGAAAGATASHDVAGAASRGPGAGTSRWRQLVAGGVALVAFLLSVAWLAGRRGESVPAGVDPRRSFLVVPFEVQGGDAAMDWLREGSVSMLTLDLAQWTDLQVVDYERTLDLLRDARLDDRRQIGLEDARRLARRGGAWTVVTGQVGRGADSLYVIARLFDVASGRRIDQAQQSAPVGGDPRSLFDALARDLLEIAGAPEINPELARTTTSSLEAYRAYLAGVRALNGWQLARADSLLGAAVDADSTFALAHYKRALGRGWSRLPDSTDVAYAAAAARHADRLRPRERDLVEGYLAMARGLDAQREGDMDAAKGYLAAARDRYEALVRRDSTDAESWYMLGDAHFHSASLDDDLSGHWTRALRAFDRTLALDSTFHLAYAHKLLIYQSGGTSSSSIVVMGDSVLVLPTDSARQAFGLARVGRARELARTAAVSQGRQWVAVDPDASQAHIALARALAAGGDFAEAARALRRAMQRPGAGTPEMPYRIAAYQLAAGDTGALTALREALRTRGLDSLRLASDAERGPALMSAASVAAGSGARRDLERVFDLFVEVEPVLPFTNVPSARLATLWRAMLLLGMGADDAAVWRDVRSATATSGAMGGDLGKRARAQSVPMLYLAYLRSRDTTHLAAIRRFTNGEIPLELLALAALERGDSAAAMRLASRMEPEGGESAAGMHEGQPHVKLRPFGQAEVYAALGEPRRALAVYESIDPGQFPMAGDLGADPRWPLWVRSFLVRGQLHEQLGESAEAARSYERFLALWGGADPSFAAELDAARAGLARVRGGGTRGG